MLRQLNLLLRLDLCANGKVAARLIARERR
ncbi:MAG: hypothetical protein JWN53_338, partial [Gemmatimonadetes bacterium]|nr:hypothetical protein [Gemmatimonadota bacterium]